MCNTDGNLSALSTEEDRIKKYELQEEYFMSSIKDNLDVIEEMIESIKSKADMYSMDIDVIDIIKDNI